MKKYTSGNEASAKPAVRRLVSKYGNLHGGIQILYDSAATMRLAGELGEFTKSVPLSVKICRPSFVVIVLSFGD